jgi:Zn-dependent metalloprotease
MAIRVRTSVLWLFLLCGASATAQPSLEKMQLKLAAEKQNTATSFYKFELNSKMPAQAGLLFSADMGVNTTAVQSWLASRLELRQGIDALQQQDKKTMYAGTEISRLQQYFKGIKVEHGVIALVTNADKIRLMQMEFYPVSAALRTTPSVSEAAALQKAMEFAGARKYIWQDNPAYTKPVAALVIVEDIFASEKGRMCLAYKFEVFAAEPASHQYIYVDAHLNKVVFTDVVVKHLDEPNRQRQTNTHKQVTVNNSRIAAAPFTAREISNASNSTTTTAGYALAEGFLKYSGNQFFTTEEVNANLYRLRAKSSDNSTVYETYNANHKSFPNFSLADITDFTDNDNHWDEAQYIFDTTNAALDIHWGVEQVIDYWWKVHNRKSYDNNNGAVLSLFHYGVKFGGAFWSSQSKVMFYGDGSQDGQGFNALTSLDITAHEIGHGICDFTAGLVYKRESGALNEGFSDIWAACLDNYVNKADASLNKNPFLVADEVVEVPGRDCLRDMTAPTNWNQPDTYQDTNGFWFDTNVENCPVPIHQDSAMGNDFCGVHVNSGVLNKWFYLITHGDGGTNGYGQAYQVDSMGFDKTEKIAFYTEMILTPNAGFESARIASINAVQVLASFPNAQAIVLADTANIIKAWNAVGVTTDSIYNMGNTPAFASNVFTSIATGQRGYIWAGTANNGLYKFNGRTWQKSPTLTNHNIAQILPDKDGGVWIAQYGRTGAQAIMGGIGYYADTSFTYLQYSTAEGLPTRNVRGIFIDNSLPVTQKYKRVWAGCFADLTAGISRPGAVVRGLQNPVSPKFFDKTVNGVNQSNGFCLSVAGNKNEVWVFASSNAGTAGQILRYRSADTVFLGAIDNTNQPVFAAGFNVKAMYYDEVKRRWWIGLTTGGVVVLDSASNTWSSINFPAIFPAGTIVNNNAITGDTQGNIYIGTTNGLVFFGSQNAAVVANPTDAAHYKRLTTADGLPSDNIRSVALDYRASRILLATENGIAFRHFLCKECINTGPQFSVMPGNWSNPGIWASGQVPGLTANVIIRHPVTVTQDANCNSLKIEGQGNVTVNAGATLNIESSNYNSNQY